MIQSEIEKSKAHILIDLIEYVPHSVVTRTLIRKLTGNINAIAIDSGESCRRRFLPSILIFRSLKVKLKL